MSEVFSPFVFPKYDRNTVNVDFGSEGILPTHLDRDYLESDDPGMKRRILEEIKILTSKMKLQSTHFYLNPQIDDELVYTYLRYCPEELAILNKWIRFPNKNFVNKLYKVADKLAKYTSFNKDKAVLYRGFWHSDNKSRANQKYAQQRLGLAEVQTEGSVLKKPGSQFRYVLTGPISFTRSSHIANKFGTIVISASMKDMPHKFIDDNDSLIAAVFINNGFFRIPKLYDHVRFLKEVIVLPVDMKTEVKFRIKQSPVPLYYTPFNEETFKKNQQVEDEKFSLKNSLYTGILKVMGLDDYNNIDINTYDTDFGLETIDTANEGFLSNLFSKVKPVDARIEEITKLAKAYLERIEKYNASSADLLMVCKTNSTNDIFPEKLTRAAFKTLPSFITLTKSLTNDVLSEDEIVKLINVFKKAGMSCGFSRIGESETLVSKEIDHKCTHGRVFELGYNSPTIKSLCDFIVNNNVVKIFADLEEVILKHLKNKDIELEGNADIFNKLFQAYVDLQMIVIYAFDSLGNVLKRTYNPLKEYMENKDAPAEEGIMDWMKGTDAKQVKTEVDRMLSIIDNLLPKHPLLKKNVNFIVNKQIDYNYFINRKYGMFLKLFELKNNSYSINEVNLKLLNEFHSFCNELSDKFNNKNWCLGYYSFGFSKQCGLNVNGTHKFPFKYYKTNPISIDQCKYRAKLLTEASNILLKLLNKYEDLKPYIGLIDDNGIEYRDEWAVINFVTTISDGIELMYKDEDALSDAYEDGDDLFGTIKMYVREANSIFKSSTVLKDCILEFGEEYTLDFVVKSKKATESISIESKDVVTREESFNDIALALEYHYKFINNYNFDVANESFSSVVTNMVVYIADCIIKLFNNFKTTIFKFYKTLKRTELRYYAESNTLKLKQIFSVPYTDMADVEVDIPRGMVKPYKVVTNNLIEILTVLDMKNRSEGFLSKIMDLEQKVTTNSDLSMSKKLGSVEDISVIQKTYNEVTKCFSNSERALKKKFSKVFEDDNCFEDTYNLLLNSETFDYEVSTIHNNLEKCEKHILNVVDYIKKNKTELNKSDILDLSKSTMTLAKIFDMYGNCILNKQKVEHNFVYVLNAIKRACL